MLVVLLHFNSIKVRLEQKSTQWVSCTLKFQFHKGTIRTIFSCSTVLSASYFNSIKVRLEPTFCQSIPSTFSHFNSIKVRLEPASIEKPICKNGFQFHKGTIRTKLSQAFEDCENVFQFHKGTIRTQPQPSFRWFSSPISIP